MSSELNLSIPRLWFELNEQVGVTLEEFNVKQGVYPDESTWANYDGFIVGGSLNSAYDIERVAWIRSLTTVLKRMNEKQCKMFGVCFGHQILAQTFGGKVIANPKGPQFAARPMSMDRSSLPTDLKHSLPEGMSEEISLFVTHSDIVSELPPGACSFCASGVNAHELLTIGDNILSVQAHPEFGASAKGRDVFRKLTEDAYEKKVIDEVTRDAALGSVKANSQDTAILRLALAFFQPR